VAQVQMQAEDAVALALEVPPELAAQYAGQAGQHIVIRATLEGEEVRRTYSLVSAAGEPRLRIVARVHPEGRLSNHLARRLRPGDRLEVLPPNGSFLFYGNRTMARAMCLEELLALKDRHLDRLALHFLMSREPQEVQIYNGRLDGAHVRELGRAFFAPEDIAECFICGPGDMIDSVSHALRDLGVEAARIRAEHFTATVAAGAAVAADSAAGAVAGAPDMAEVTVIMDGRRRSFTMRMNGDSVLEGAEKAGIELPFSCRAGVCSTCRTKVVRGEVAMEQNHALEDWELEQGYVLACQSRVKTRELVLDYDER
jgi:ring-1,2-phenylacetyl-CoA epoxidase subunit PaaE